MSGISNQRTWLGQENGPEVELIVSGTALYATYETLDGFPAVYDDARGPVLLRADRRWPL